MRTRSGETKTFNYTISAKNGSSTISWGGLESSDFPVTVVIDSVTNGSQSYTPDVNTYVLKL
ncbi:MAG: hypothetical protein RIB98_16010 [Acidimicrobiales bacterium]